MKLCRSCKTEKDESEFGKRAASNDGLAHKCKQCQKEYDAKRLKDPKRMKMRRDYQKTEKGKDAHKKANKRWIEKNTVKRAAHIIAGNAVRDGKLTVLPCEKCFSTHDIHGHHDDYARPLDVRWLCSTCHKEWHRDHGEGKNAT